MTDEELDRLLFDFDGPIPYVYRRLESGMTVEVADVSNWRCRCRASFMPDPDSSGEQTDLKWDDF